MADLGSGQTSVVAQYGAFITPVITGLVSIGVAFVTAKITAKYVTGRANLRTAFIAVLEKLEDLEEQAMTMLLMDGTNMAALHSQCQAVALIDARLGTRLTEVFRSRDRLPGTTNLDPVPSAITLARIELRKLVTDSNHAAAGRVARAYGDPIFQQLSSLCDRLRQEIRNAADQLKVSDLQ